MFVFFLLLGIGAAQLQPPPRPVEYDCALRKLALEVSLARLNGTTNPRGASWPRAVWDGLRLGECDVPPPTQDIRKKPHQAPQVTSSTVYLSPKGNDFAQGTQSDPFATLDRALATTRQLPPPRQVLLLPGTYFFGRTQSITASDAFTLIASADPVNPAVMSGSVSVTNLSWQAEGGGVYSAGLPATIDLQHASSGLWPLFVDSTPYVLARWPNANPAYDFRPVGYVSPVKYEPDDSNIAPSGQLIGSSPYDPNSHFPRYSQRIVDRSRWHDGMGVGGVVFGSSVNVPSNVTGGFSVHWDGGVKQGNGGKYPDEWMNYGYMIDAETRHASQVTLSLGSGGTQGLNVDTGDATRVCYIANAKSLIDIPGEYFVDATSKRIFIYPNGTTLSPSTTLQIPQLNTVLQLLGNRLSPVHNVTLSNLEFTGTLMTFMQPDVYEPPSANLAGWSFPRVAAVELDGVQDVSLTGLTFQYVGGNAILLSRHAHGVSISDLGCFFSGDNCILLEGPSSYGAATVDYPNATSISRVLAHNQGLYGKQVSVVSMSMSAFTTIDSVVAFNQPRAALNINDGFGMGHTVTNCVLWACVLESADHGALNSWSRENLLFVAPNSTVVSRPIPTTISHNLILAAGGTLSNLDHDDGSEHFHDDFNVLAYAGAKNYLGRLKRATNSLFVFPELGMMQGSGYFSDGDVIHAGWGEEFSNNTCIFGANFTSTFTAGSLPGCLLSNTTRCTASSNNQYFAPGPVHWEVNGRSMVNLSAMQSAGLEVGSTVTQSIPTPTEVVSMALKILQRT